MLWGDNPNYCGGFMSYTEKFTWEGKELVIKRETSPVQVLSAESAQIKLEKLNINDSALRPSNYARAEGTVLPLFQAEGVRLDLSKRTKEPMNFWHRNMDCDELIFCYKGAIHWETEQKISSSQSMLRCQ